MSAHPLGLHVHLIATGPTLRFVLWFERAAKPLAFQQFKGFERDVPFDHPNALPHRERPAWLPASFAPLTCLVTVPRLGSYLPVPLPGLITAWELSAFKTASRTLNASPYRVPAWVVPIGLSLLPLRKLLTDWSLRHGRGFVASHAAVVRDVLRPPQVGACEIPVWIGQKDRHSRCEPHIAPRPAHRPTTRERHAQRRVGRPAGRRHPAARACSRLSASGVA